MSISTPTPAPAQYSWSNMGGVNSREEGNLSATSSEVATVWVFVSSKRVSFTAGLSTHGKGKLPTRSENCAEFEMTIVFGTGIPHLRAISSVETLFRTSRVIAGGGQAICNMSLKSS